MKLACDWPFIFHPFLLINSLVPCCWYPTHWRNGYKMMREVNKYINIWPMMKMSFVNKKLILIMASCWYCTVHKNTVSILGFESSISQQLSQDTIQVSSHICKWINVDKWSIMTLTNDWTHNHPQHSHLGICPKWWMSLYNKIFCEFIMIYYQTVHINHKQLLFDLHYTVETTSFTI